MLSGVCMLGGSVQWEGELEELQSLSQGTSGVSRQWKVLQAGFSPWHLCVCLQSLVCPLLKGSVQPPLEMELSFVTSQREIS